MAHQAIAAKASIHEPGKQKRRERIIQAAAALVRDVGPERMTVAAIAQQAGLSPATVYNLFGTKSAVLAQVFDQDVSRFEAAVLAEPARNAVDRIFKAVKLATSLYDTDPQFYKAMFFAAGDEELHTIVSKPRIAFWCSMVRAACADGSLASDANADALGLAMSHLARGAIRHWAAGATTVQRLEDEISFGFALLLRSKATELTASQLEQLSRRLEAKLTDKHRKSRTSQRTI